MDSVTELHQCVDGGIEKLVAIWDDIGIVGEQRSARNRVVLMHLGNLLDEMLREEDQLRTRLKQNVDKYRTEVTRLCTELCLPLYEVCVYILNFLFRLTTCLENLEMSGNLTAVKDFTKNQGNVQEKILSGKSCLKLFIVNCIFAFIQVFSTSMGMI